MTDKEPSLFWAVGGTELTARQSGHRALSMTFFAADDGEFEALAQRHLTALREAVAAALAGNAVVSEAAALTARARSLRQEVEAEQGAIAGEIQRAEAARRQLLRGHPAGSRTAVELRKLVAKRGGLQAQADELAQALAEVEAAAAQAQERARREAEAEFGRQLQAIHADLSRRQEELVRTISRSPWLTELAAEIYARQLLSATSYARGRVAGLLEQLLGDGPAEATAGSNQKRPGATS